MRESSCQVYSGTGASGHLLARAFNRVGTALIAPIEISTSRALSEGQVVKGYQSATVRWQGNPSCAMLWSSLKCAHRGCRTASQVALPEGVALLDVGDRLVLPGMIDAHVHLLWSGSVSSGQESKVATDSQALLMGARNAQMALKSGLTTVRDCGDRNYLSLALRDCINHGDLAGPRMLCSGPVITSTAGQLWWQSIECDRVDELQKAVRTLVKHEVDFVKLMGTGGNATPGSNPEASQYDAAGFQAVANDAHRMGKKVAVHVHGVEGMRYAVDAGIDTLEHCPFQTWPSPTMHDWWQHGGARPDCQSCDTGDVVRLRAEDMREPRTHPGHLWVDRYETIRRMRRWRKAGGEQRSRLHRNPDRELRYSWSF